MDTGVGTVQFGWLQTGHLRGEEEEEEEGEGEGEEEGARSQSFVRALVFYRSFSSLVTRLVIRPHSSPTRKRTHTLSAIMSRM